MQTHENVVIVGAGPAGLTAAYELSKHGVTGTVVEADSVVGGIARTVERDGYRFDIGGHRFFTKVKEIEALWDEMLQEPMLTRPRMSRIFYGGKFYDYPLKATNALRNMGVLTASACMLSYAKARARPIANPVNFEQWVTNQFGAKLFNMFFKSYTEKVWGCSCTELGRRLGGPAHQGPSLGEAVRNALFGAKKNGEVVKTLIDEFRYPRHGPGQLWEACTKTIQEKGWTVQMQTKVTGIDVQDGKVTGVETRTRDGRTAHLPADQLFSTMPLRELLQSFNHARRPRSSTRPASWPIATSSPSPWCSIRPTCSPTTGSTSTRPRSASAAFRTSAIGAPRWCPMPAIAAWAGVLRQRGGRPLVHVGRGPGEARARRSEAHRAGRRQHGQGVRRADPQGLPGLRPRLQGAARTRSAGISRASRTSTASAATGSTATTTRTTRWRPR
jgi:hypothetical protein